MDKDAVLNEIFNNDPFGLLKVKPKKTGAPTADERLLSSFEEINSFVETSGAEPKANSASISEYQLYSRLKSLRDDEEKVQQLKAYDRHGLLPEMDEAGDAEFGYQKEKTFSSIEDILGDDIMGILGDDNDQGLFDFKHTPKEQERAESDFIARRKPCKDFERYASLFKEVQKDLAGGQRKLINFRLGNLKEGTFYVHNGVLFFLEKIKITQKAHYRMDGTRVREDGRTRCIFENGTQSNMLKRSVEKILYTNGMVVTDNFQQVNNGFLEQFGTITEEDKQAGYIYVLKSKSKNENISSIQHLYKIGYSKTEVEERIKNAEKEPTYLMAPVNIKGVWQCFNMNPQKLELLLHNFFGSSCLELDVFDSKGRRHTPREWFIAPFEVIEQSIELILNGKIIDYKYDMENQTIVSK